MRYFQSQNAALTRPCKWRCSNLFIFAVVFLFRAKMFLQNIFCLHFKFRVRFRFRRTNFFFLSSQTGPQSYIDPSQQDGRRRRRQQIHWAMAAPLRLNLLINYQIWQNFANWDHVHIDSSQRDQTWRFFALWATINLPKSPTFLGNFCKGVKIFNFSSKIIFGQLLWTFGDFFLVTLILPHSVSFLWHIVSHYLVYSL